MKNILYEKFKIVREFVEKYERHLSSGALLCGFIFDYFTLTRADQFYDNLVLIFYLSLVAIIIFFLNAYEIGMFRKKVFEYVYTFAPIVMQFAFGGLFSGFTVFYLRSTSFAGSIVFLGVLVGLLVGNEFFRERYKIFVFQISIFFFSLYAYFIFAVPVLMGSIGRGVFLLSGLTSLIIVSVFLFLIFKFTPGVFLASRKYLIKSILCIFVGMNILYFLNIIPPIPLVLKDAGVYHSVYRNNTGDYVVHYEPTPWFKKLLLGQTFPSVPGDDVYFFSAVFSPTKFETPIIHHWQYLDQTKRRWVSVGKIEFKTVGGRDGGYRGYSKKSAVYPGSWRVDVETEGGQVLGRVLFDIERTSEPVVLEEKIL